MEMRSATEVTKLSTERRTNYPLIASRILNCPLMVTRHELFAALAALAPRLGLAPLEAVDPKFLTPDPRYTSYRVLDGGVGAVPIHGALVHKSMGIADAPSGLTSYQDIVNDFDAAERDSAVSVIALVIDSPGGEVQGAFDSAEHIFAARGRKPIVAILDENACSAAYLLAAAADEIWIPQTGMAGSIGVRGVHVDRSKANEMAGLRITEVYEGDRKNDGSPNEPLSAAALERFQAEVHAVYGMLIEAVHRYRELPAAAIRSWQSAEFRGQDALEVGLVDRVIASVQGIEELQARRSAAGNWGTGMNDPKKTSAEKPTVDEPKKEDEKPQPDAPAAAPETPAKETATVYSIAEARDRARLELVKEQGAAIAAINLAAKALARPDLAGRVIERMIADGLTLDAARIVLFELHQVESPTITGIVSPLAPAQGGQRLSVAEIYERRRQQALASTNDKRR
jgi:ClpP class serine protease